MVDGDGEWWMGNGDWRLEIGDWAVPEGGFALRAIIFSHDSAPGRAVSKMKWELTRAA
jgi:hypothetical protein